MNSFVKHRKKQKGAALLIALFAITLMLFIAVEISYESSVEYAVAAQQVNRLKAYYAAKAGVEISLLRIQIYKKVMGSFGQSMGEAKSLLDPIWQMPFSWPPMVPEDLNAVDKDLMKTAVGKSIMEGQYLATIEAEGGKLDINDLASPAVSLRQATREQLKKILGGELERNEEFNSKYTDQNLEEVINNIEDWVDEDSESKNGGDEKSGYSEMQSDFIPPNQAFKTLEELHMVKGVNDDIFSVLERAVTIWGTKGINVNYANADSLKSLDVSMTDEAVQEVLARRSNPEKGGLFKSPQDFLGFISGFGVRTDNIDPSNIITDTEFNFRIRSTGQSGNVARELVVVTYDLETTRKILRKKINSDLDKALTEGQTAQGGASPAPTEVKGRPNIVFWGEN